MWDVGCGMWDVVYGMWDVDIKVKEPTFETMARSSLLPSFSLLCCAFPLSAINGEQSMDSNLTE